MDERFTILGMRSVSMPAGKKAKWYTGKPMLSILFLVILVIGCLCCDLFIPKDPVYMDLYNTNMSPSQSFLFGTDHMGRDIFSMIWYGGRISLSIGFLAASISAGIGILVGTVSGLVPQWLDNLLMRLTEILLSIPGLLLIVLLQAILGEASVLNISLVIGVTGWTGIAKVVRTEVKKLRSSEFIVAARCSGAGIFRILCKHLIPNFFSSIAYMAVMNIRSAIVAESTLSFLGLGLPLEVITWGSMLSLAENALLSGAWWVLLIPGIFLAITMVCVTNIGQYLQRGINKKYSNL